MAYRITDSDLAALVLRLNRLMGTPETPYTEGKANVGNFHISHAYGGVCLHQMMSAGGGVRTILDSGHVPKRELFEKMHAFIAGIETARGER